MGRHISIENLKEVLRNPKKLRLVSGAVRRELVQINRKWSQRSPVSHDNYLEEDWRVLIILDAARPEMLGQTTLAEQADEVSTRASPGSHSNEFLQRTFAGEQHHDTVYVSGNPFMSNIPEGTFHAVENLYDDAWDSETMTVPPDAVANRAISAADRFPNKRIIAHFMQPHYPFIGEAGEEISASLGGTDPWHQIYHRNVDRQAVIKAYRENHEFVVPYAQDLIGGVKGRKVVTADHANFIGERGFPIPIRQYGHPYDYPHPTLRTVPWYVFYGEDCEVTTGEPIIQESSPDGEIIEERLSALGYR